MTRGHLVLLARLEKVGPWARLDVLVSYLKETKLLLLDPRVKLV